MDVAINKKQEVRAVIVYPNHAVVRLNDDVRIDLPTETLEIIYKLYKEAKNSPEAVGVAVNY